MYRCIICWQNNVMLGAIGPFTSEQTAQDYLALFTQNPRLNGELATRWSVVPMNTP